jgi:hypothetical protein
VFILCGPATPIRIDNGQNRTTATFVELPCTQHMTSSTLFFSTAMPTGSWTSWSLPGMQQACHLNVKELLANPAQETQ